MSSNALDRARYAPLVAYLLFLIVGHPAAFLPGVNGTVALAVFAVTVPTTVLLIRHRVPASQGRAPLVLGILGSATFIGGLVWLGTMEPNNDLRPMVAILVGHAALIGSAVTAASAGQSSRL